MIEKKMIQGIARVHYEDMISMEDIRPLVECHRALVNHFHDIPKKNDVSGFRERLFLSLCQNDGTLDENGSITPYFRKLLNYYEKEDEK